ncbi:MAG TPA: FAD/NAD(P)-binding oxidoreductase, partial [Eubacteriaceae bacterium]|nr:FAD/NAD(P)-binding oxidoreductase [Eubacteriaceae bacterium]
FQTPRGGTKGILATPTIHGNFMLGPNAAFTDDREELKTTAEGLKEVAEIGKKTVPNVDFSKVITQFSGLRASMATYDFVIEESKKGFVNLIGIDSPGLTASPAIALKVEEIVKNSGLDLKEDPNFSSYRTPYIRLENMSNEEINELIAQEPTYGKIVCRCETITEGEIRDVLSRKVPVMTVDGIKRRARATSGRCQGGFCTPKVLDILSDVYGKDPTEITKNGPGANLLTGRTKVATGGGK